MNTIKGKILRINADGTIPNDNPFFNTATGQNRAIWALGLRNPYRFGVQPGTGKILINDVGNGSWEEINLGVAGANYGWNATEGPTTDPRFRSPLFAYPHQGSVGHGHRLRHRRRRLLQPDHRAVPVVLRREILLRRLLRGLDPRPGSGRRARRRTSRPASTSPSTSRSATTARSTTSTDLQARSGASRSPRATRLHRSRAIPRISRSQWVSRRRSA